MAYIRVKDRPKKKNLIGDEEEKASLEIREVLGGVSATWLAKLFRMDYKTAVTKLASCPELGRGRGNVVLYDVAQAAGYLVKPKVNVEEWIKTLRPADLPAYLQKDFWEAQNKRQQYEENAGDLWRTEKVVEVFADTFKLIKETMQLWADHVERKEGLSSEQRGVILQLVDGLQQELHKKLVEMEKLKKTTNEFAAIADIEGEVNRKEDTKFSNGRKMMRRELI